MSSNSLTDVATNGDKCLLVDGSDKILKAITENIPFKVVGLERVRLQQKNGFRDKLRINLDLLVQGLSISPGIKSLCFRECIFNSQPIEAARCLGRLIQTHPTLEEITLGHTLYSEGFEYFFDGLKYNSTLKKINATYIDVSEEAALSFREALRVNTTLQELDMEGAKFTSVKALKYVVEAIGLNKSIKKLSISHIENRDLDYDEHDPFENINEPPRKRQKTGLTNEIAVDYEDDDSDSEDYVDYLDLLFIENQFRESLLLNTTLTSLKLTHSEIFPVFGEILTTNKTLTSLEFEGCEIASDSSLAEISKALKVTTTLRSFSFLECTAFANQWHAIQFDALATNTSLTALGFNGYGLSNNGVEDFFQSLAQNTTLRALDVSMSNFSPVAIQLLGDYLTTNNTLTKLEAFSIGNEADVSPIIEALDNNTTLRWLELGGNELTNRMCKDFAKILRKNQALQHLRISDCYITDDGSIRLSEGLRYNRSLTSLDMSSNGMQEASMLLVCDALLQHPKLTKFVFTTEQEDENGAFARLLSTNTVLETLDLQGGPKNVKSTALLCNALKINTTLTSLKSSQYCEPPSQIAECRNLLIDALQVNESIISYEGFDISVTDGIEPLIAKNLKLRKDRLNNILVLSHNILRTHKQIGEVTFPIEVWQHIFSYLKYPGIKENFFTMFQAVAKKNK